MSFIPEILENCEASVFMVWFAGIFREKSFKKKYSQREIFAVDLEETGEAISEIIDVLDRRTKTRKFVFTLMVKMAYGMTNIVTYQLAAFINTVKSFEKDLAPIDIKFKIEASNRESSLINFEEIPDVDVNFIEDFPADKNLLSEPTSPSLKEITFPELESAFGSVSLADMEGFMMETSLENDLFRVTFRDRAFSTSKDVSAPDEIFDVTLTPSKRRKPTETDTPSKRRRKTLENLFNTAQEELQSPDNRQPEVNIEVSVPEPELEPEPQPFHTPSPEQEASPPVIPEQEPTDIPAAQGAEPDSLQQLDELDLSFLRAPKRRKGQKAKPFSDPVTFISGDQIKRNQIVDICTVPNLEVRLDLKIHRQTVHDLFNLPSTTWFKTSFRHIAGNLLANYQSMLVPSRPANAPDVARPASVHPTAQLSDDVPRNEQPVQTEHSEIDQIPAYDSPQDRPDNREQTDTEPTVDLPEISAPELDSETQDLASENGNAGLTFDKTAIDLTLPVERDSNDSVFFELQRKSSQSKSSVENIIDINDCPPLASPTSSLSQSSWNAADLEKQLEVLFEENPVVRFDNLVPPDNNTKLDAVICFNILLKMAFGGSISLEQEENDEALWIFK